MKEKTKLRVIQLLCIISILFTAFSIQKTYAKYFEKVNTTYATNIKKWVINVNNNNIHENDTLSEVMEPVLVENDHMNNNNTLVPGREGYFPFLVDYSSVDLAFQFGFNLTQINTTPLEDFEVYGYKITDGENIRTIETKDMTAINPIIDPNAGSITYTKIVIVTEEELEELNVLEEIEELEDGTKKVKIQETLALNTDKKVQVDVLFRWNDENADTEDAADVEGMNNLEDTQFVGEDNGENIHKLLNYNVAITFTQYIIPSQGQGL